MSNIRKDLHNNIEPAVAFNTQAIGSSTTTHGNIIDTQGYGALEYLIQAGTLTDGTYTPVLEEGDDSGLSDAAVVDASNLLGTIAAATFAPTDDNKVKRIGVILGVKRYQRLSLVSATVTTGGTIGATAVLGNPDNLPTA